MDLLSERQLALCDEVRVMCTCNQLRRATRTITQLYDAAMAPSGLKVTQLPILVGLVSIGDMSIGALADALAVDRTTLTRNVRVLEQRDLVRSVGRDGDARVRMLTVTPAGSQMLSDALVRWQEVQGAVEREVGRERLRALYGELAAVSQAAGDAS
jgi:DNA-binding MarR family transcriptional regulator